MPQPSAVPSPPPTIAPPGAGDRVLVIAPHPDDESIATGGLLAQAHRAGAAVRVVIATSGENNPWAQRAYERRVVLGPRARIRFSGRREAEALAALAALGIDRAAAVFLRLPDQGLTDLLLRDAAGLCDRVAHEIATFAPTVLAAPSAADLHPDHSALAVATELALARVLDPSPRPPTLAFVVHNPRLRRGHLPYLTLDKNTLQRKGAAIACHASQLILRGGFLRSFAAPQERFLTTLLPGPAPPHPVEDVLWDDNGLTVGLRPRLKARAWGRATLYILPGSATWPPMAAPLPRLATHTQWVELATTRPVSDGQLRRMGSRLELTLPASAVAREEVLFLKLARRFGFFDEAGWVRVQRWPGRGAP
jgi:LmbE family N-acetylglucosaminyl deacetylase